MRAWVGAVGTVVVALASATVSQASAVAQARASPDVGPAPLLVSFDASSSLAEPGRTIVTYAWNFGDGTHGTGMTTTHAYGVAGRYAVTLVVTDDTGASASGRLEVHAESLELEAPSASVTHGTPFLVRATLSPARVGAQLAIERGSDASWQVIAQAVTDETGIATATIRGRESGALRARVADSGTTSGEVPLSVGPRVRLGSLVGAAYLGASLSARVWPHTYRARVKIVVRRGLTVVARSIGRVRDGVLSGVVPTPGVGRFRFDVVLPGVGSLASTVVRGWAVSRGRVLTVGSRGPDVRAVLSRLAELRFRVPGGDRTSFGHATVDSVYAFQKAYGLARTGVVGEQEWRLLERVTTPRPRYRGPSPHIEVDKTRQVLLVVERGEVVAVLPASSGATGNTPEGRHRIRWKAPSTTTWLGPAILYRTLTFYENRFAIHGFPSVPPYPASSGCVRIPIWTADWLYNRSPVGETVYVYR